MAEGGQPGNNNAGRGKIVKEAIRKAVLQNKRLDRLVKKLIDLADDGDLVAMKEVFDRLEGKAVQGIANETEQEWVVEVKK